MQSPTILNLAHPPQHKHSLALTESHLYIEWMKRIHRNNPLWGSLLGFLFLSGVLAMPAQAQEARLSHISICITDSLPSVQVEGQSLHFFDDELGLLVHQSEGKRIHTLKINNGGVAVDGKRFETSRLRIRSTNNWLRYNGRVFREDMIAIRDPHSPEKLILVNDVLLEQYLYGLINKECLKSWPIEAKKAQAVAARTYAIFRKINQPKPICDMGATALDQVYGGYLAEDDSARLAVDKTKGQVLTYRNQIAEAYYHSTCGGHTTNSSDVWKGKPGPEYLSGVTCNTCSKSPSYRWSTKIKKSELARKLEIPSSYRKNFTFDIIQRDESGRVQKFRFHYGGQVKILSGEEVRKRVGYGRLKSTAFSFKVVRGLVTFTGKGLGHGVGMCQWGAAGMANQGYGYKAILNHYYPGTQLRPIY